MEIEGSDNLSKREARERYRQSPEYQAEVAKYPSLDELAERNRKNVEIDDANRALLTFTLTQGFSSFCVKQILFEFKKNAVWLRDRTKDPVLKPLFEFHDRYLSGRFPATEANLVATRETETQVFEACADRIEFRKRFGPENPVSDIAWADYLYGTTPAPVNRTEVMDKLITVNEVSLDDDYRN